jgi:hypothetical protein
MPSEASQFSESHKYKTKQNKQTTLLHRYTSVACAVCSSVTTCSTNFSFKNLVFGILFEFSAAEIT